MSAECSSSPNENSSSYRGVSKAIYENGHFSNPPHFGFALPGFGSVMKFLWTKNEGSYPGEEILNETLPVRRPDFTSEVDDKLRATWLGHATVLVQMEGVTFLTDPVWCARCSPVPFTGPPRYRPPPVAIEDLPPIDFAVVSHNHYDHLDAQAVSQLAQRFEDMHWFVPSKLGATMRSFGCQHVTELSWTESAEFRSPRTNATCTVTATPAKHWSLRSGFDRFKTLWAGWAVATSKRRFYFAGDTGFCEAEFAAIGQHYGPFDLAAIPIGCYEPRAFMRSQHVDPGEAIRIHQLIRANKSIGIHWGTYKMGSKEFYLEPKIKLLELAKEILHSEDSFIAPDHGETIVIQ